MAAIVGRQGEDTFPLVGAGRCDGLQEARDALDVLLSVDDRTAIGCAVPKAAAAGGRYSDQQLAFIASER